jgi:hypothetical protein
MTLYHYQVRVKYDKPAVKGEGSEYSTAIVWATSEARARAIVWKWLRAMPGGDIVSVEKV